MNDQPDAPTLLRAVEGFLEHQVVPKLNGPARYHARVAANVVAIVAREIETEESHWAAEWERLGGLLGEQTSPPDSRDAYRDALRARNEELAARIREGKADRGEWRRAVVAHLRETVDAKLAVSRPPRQGRS